MSVMKVRKYMLDRVRSTVGSGDHDRAGERTSWYRYELGLRCEQYIMARRSPMERYHMHMRKRAVTLMEADRGVCTSSSYREDPSRASQHMDTTSS